MSECTIPPPSVISCPVRPLDKVCREEAQETLMDRVLVTPRKKKSGRLSRRFTSRSKPNAPLHSLRHHSQRASSSHAFSPSCSISEKKPCPRCLGKFSQDTEEQTTSNIKWYGPLPISAEDTAGEVDIILYGVQIDRSYFINSASETPTSVTKRRLMVDSHSPSKQVRRLPKSSCIRIKPFKASVATASSSLGSPGHLNHREADLDLDTIAMEAKHSVQDMDIALDFQALQLDEHDASPSRKDHGCKALNLLVTRLQTALAAETKARKEAEQQLVREMKRRIELEELVALLQHERDEPSSNQHPFPSSSPLLTSSPCISSESVISSALPLPP